MVCVWWGRNNNLKPSGKDVWGSTRVRSWEERRSAPLTLSSEIKDYSNYNNCPASDPWWPQQVTSISPTVYCIINYYFSDLIIFLQRLDKINPLRGTLYNSKHPKSSHLCVIYVLWQKACWWFFRLSPSPIKTNLSYCTWKLPSILLLIDGISVLEKKKTCNLLFLTLPLLKGNSESSIEVSIGQVFISSQNINKVLKSVIQLVLYYKGTHSVSGNELNISGNLWDPLSTCFPQVQLWLQRSRSPGL